MITCEQITAPRKCDNCDRVMPMVLRYAFIGPDPWDEEKRDAEYGALVVCEDCSCALTRLHFKVMERGKPHKYDMDEISEVIP